MRNILLLLVCLFSVEGLCQELRFPVESAKGISTLLSSVNDQRQAAVLQESAYKVQVQMLDLAAKEPMGFPAFEYPKEYPLMQGYLGSTASAKSFHFFFERRKELFDVVQINLENKKVKKAEVTLPLKKGEKRLLSFVENDTLYSLCYLKKEGQLWLYRFDPLTLTFGAGKVFDFDVKQFRYSLKKLVHVPAHAEEPVDVQGQDKLWLQNGVLYLLNRQPTTSQSAYANFYLHRLDLNTQRTQQFLLPAVARGLVDYTVFQNKLYLVNLDPGTYLEVKTYAIEDQLRYLNALKFTKEKELAFPYYQFDGEATSTEAPDKSRELLKELGDGSFRALVYPLSNGKGVQLVAGAYLGMVNPYYPHQFYMPPMPTGPPAGVRVPSFNGPMSQEPTQYYQEVLYFHPVRLSGLTTQFVQISLDGEGQLLPVQPVVAGMNSKLRSVGVENFAFSDAKVAFLTHRGEWVYAFYIDRKKESLVVELLQGKPSPAP